MTVDQRDREIALGQRFRGRQSAKARTDDDDVGVAKPFIEARHDRFLLVFALIAGTRGRDHAA